jgi:hypothetical protein
MGRPPDTPRLAKLSPKFCARHAAELIRTHISDSRKQADRVLVDEVICHVAIGSAIEVLARWAKAGHPSLKTAALATFDALVKLLFRAPLMPPTPPCFDHEDPLQLAMAAARARKLVEAGKPVSSPDLAALAGFDRSRPRQLVRDGILRRCSDTAGRRGSQDAPIRNDDARALLRQRRVPGFENDNAFAPVQEQRTGFED